MHRLEGEVVASAASNAEGRDFTHIDPCTIIAGNPMVSGHLVNPPLLSAFGQPVREDSVSGPDSTDINAAIRVLQESSSFVSSFKDRISGGS